ncbi:MAG: hypothetical protein U9Q89_02390 [Thermodesulfobacteriota bacterium]|nr:hypothetical protein [Thermodesulfobacteriota bacterium]
MQDANELEERKTNYGIGLDELIMRVTGDIGIDMKDLLSSKREQKISNARAIISYPNVPHYIAVKFEREP